MSNISSSCKVASIFNKEKKVLKQHFSIWWKQLAAFCYLIRHRGVPSLSRLSTVCCTLFRIVGTTVITGSLTSSFWGDNSPVSSNMMAIHPSLALSHTSQIKNNWICAIRSIKVCLVQLVQKKTQFIIPCIDTVKNNILGEVDNIITEMENYPFVDTIINNWLLADIKNINTDIMYII